MTSRTLRDTVTRSSQIGIFLASPILLVPYIVNLYLLN